MGSAGRGTGSQDEPLTLRPEQGATLDTPRHTLHIPKPFFRLQRLQQAEPLGQTPTRPSSGLDAQVWGSRRAHRTLAQLTRQSPRVCPSYRGKQGRRQEWKKPRGGRKRCWVKLPHGTSQPKALGTREPGAPSRSDGARAQSGGLAGLPEQVSRSHRPGSGLPHSPSAPLPDPGPLAEAQMLNWSLAFYYVYY